MESVIAISVILAIIITNYVLNKRENAPMSEELHHQAMVMAEQSEEKQKELMNSNGDQPASPRTRDLLLETLTKIGCQYEIDEDDQIRFMWQGGHFAADADNDCAFVVVWYLYWDEYELYDIDALSRVKRVMNDANIKYNINVIYSVDEAGSTFYVHSKKHFLFIPQIPDIEGYLQSLLGMFFHVRNYVDSEIEKQKSEEEKVSQ